MVMGREVEVWISEYVLLHTWQLSKCKFQRTVLLPCRVLLRRRKNDPAWFGLWRGHWAL